MKIRLLIIVAATALLFAQSDPTTTALQIDLATTASAVSKAQSDLSGADAKIKALVEQVASLQSQLATMQPPDPRVTRIQSKCANCIDTLDGALAPPSITGTFQGVVICCGTNTVPPTTPGSFLIYVAPPPSK